MVLGCTNHGCLQGMQFALLLQNHGLYTGCKLHPVYKPWFAGDCATIFNNPTPSSKVRNEADRKAEEEEAKRQVLGDLQPPAPLPVSHGVI